MWETWFRNSMTFNIKPWFVQPSLLSNFRTVLSSLKRNSIPRISHSSLPYSQSLLSSWKMLLLNTDFWVTVSLFLPSQTPGISLYCLLTHILSDKKVHVILVFAPLYVMCILLLFLFWCHMSRGVWLVCMVCLSGVWGVCACVCACGMKNTHMHMCVLCVCTCVQTCTGISVLCACVCHDECAHAYVCCVCACVCICVACLGFIFFGDCLHFFNLWLNVPIIFQHS